MSFTLCTQQQAINKAGANANSTAIASGTLLGNWSDEAEAILCTAARYDVVANFSALTSNGKQIFQNLSSNLIAQNIIHYDAGGYTDAAEAQLMFDNLENQIRRGLEFIEEDKNKKYLGINS